MKLEKILDLLNSFEKNAFLKTIDNIISNQPRNLKAIDKILNNASGDLKAMDSQNIVKVFELIQPEFSNYLSYELSKSTNQLGILSDILIRDGNCIMKLDWFSKLYDSEIKKLKTKIKSFEQDLKSENSEIDKSRQRDYQIYQSCVRTAYTNDDQNNQERKITFDEQTILNTLSIELELSNEEIKLINYTILPLTQIGVDTAINDLRNLGILFFSKKTNTIYVADELIRITRQIKGKPIADKFFRRVLRQLREPLINMICKKHNINWRLSKEEKIKEIIKEGISIKGILTNDIFKEDTSLTEKKKFINELCDKNLKISPAIKGATVYEKVDSIIQHFNTIESDEKVGISIEGYEKMLTELDKTIPKTNTFLKKEFELQEETVMSSSYLLNFNIKPRDVLEILSENELKKLCETQSISSRGDIIFNILENYKDTENLYLENYNTIAHRDLKKLKENSITIKESEIGLLFEDLTKNIFSMLGFSVDEELKKRLNTAKDKIDIILKTSENEVILVECKTNKDGAFNKFSSVSRQLKSYIKLIEKNELRVIKTLLIGPEFSDDFIKDCGLDYELNLSLITSKTLYRILESFKISKMEQLPYNLLMRDVLIQEERVIKAISK